MFCWKLGCRLLPTRPPKSTLYEWSQDSTLSAPKPNLLIIKIRTGRVQYNGCIINQYDEGQISIKILPLVTWKPPISISPNLASPETSSTSPIISYHQIRK